MMGDGEFMALLNAWVDRCQKEIDVKQTQAGKGERALRLLLDVAGADRLLQLVDYVERGRRRNEESRRV